QAYGSTASSFPTPIYSRPGRLARPRLGRSHARRACFQNGAKALSTRLVGRPGDTRARASARQDQQDPRRVGWGVGGLGATPPLSSCKRTCETSRLVDVGASLASSRRLFPCPPDRELSQNRLAPGASSGAAGGRSRQAPRAGLPPPQRPPVTNGDPGSEETGDGRSADAECDRGTRRSPHACVA